MRRLLARESPPRYFTRPFFFHYFYFLIPKSIELPFLPYSHLPCQPNKTPSKRPTTTSAKKSIAYIEHENIQTTLHPFITNARVLELACSSGFYTYDFLKWGAKSVRGVDISPVMIEQAKNGGSSPVGTTPASVASKGKVEFMLADASKPRRYPEEGFDVVFAAWLWNYAPDRAGLVDMFRNVALNLKPGGHFVTITVPPVENPMDSIDADLRVRPGPEGSGGLYYSVNKFVEDGVDFHVKGHTPIGDVDFDCYHLRKSLYEEAAREAGLKRELRWGRTEVPERYLRGEGQGDASTEELRSYKDVTNYGVLVIEKYFGGGKTNRSRKRDRQPRSDVHSVTPDFQSNRSRIPNLTHAYDHPSPPCWPSERCRRPNGQLFLILPYRPVEEHPSRFVENEMLFQYNGHPWNDLITHTWEEVFEDAEQMITSCNGTDKFDRSAEYAPRPAWDDFCVAAEDLGRQCCRVSAGGIAGDGAESEDDHTEATKSAETVVAFEKQSSGRDRVDFAPAEISGHTSVYTYSDQIAEDQSKPCTGSRHGKGDPFGCCGWGVDIEVCAGSKPDNAGELQGEEGATACGKGAGVTAEGGRGIVKFCRPTQKDQNGEHLWDEGPSSTSILLAPSLDLLYRSTNEKCHTSLHLDVCDSKGSDSANKKHTHDTANGNC
ncbi:MAG: hypothetical protein Q9166_008140 [cf. Caloplaca sp. 2 TL-2023]